MKGVTIIFEAVNTPGHRLWGVTKITSTLKDGKVETDETMLVSGMTPLPANSNEKEKAE